MSCVITAVSVDELRQAACLDDDSQQDDASSRCTCELESDSECSFPQQKVTSDELMNTI